MGFGCGLHARKIGQTGKGSSAPRHAAAAAASVTTTRVTHITRKGRGDSGSPRRFCFFLSLRRFSGSRLHLGV